ncbi:MAG TPA: 4-hydroxy-tetrahydrodipicolinate reductase [Saprospiraceae bacterium]|nr:4-hydroxy-tetrahydrodipicolinate reductase [Saprospiraceae bacterium]
MKRFSVAVLGKGRMGQLVAEQLRSGPHQFAGFITEETNPSDVENMQVDVVVDFSIPEALEAWLPEIINSKAGLITGTTGLNDEQQKMLEKAADKISVLQASNFSIGVSRMKALVRMLSASIGPQCEIELIEKHHNQKVDAPSGTAIELADNALDELGADWKWSADYPVRGKRPDHVIQIHALRGGNITGEHEMLFILPDEVISVRHTALNRKIFAQGAVHSLEFILGKSNGFYSLEDTFNTTK